MLWAVIPAAIAGIVIAFFLLPVILAIRVTEDGEDTALDLRLDLAAWRGALGAIVLRQAGADRWEARLRLFGRTPRRPCFALGHRTDVAHRSSSDSSASQDPEKDTAPTVTQEHDIDDGAEHHIDGAAGHDMDGDAGRSSPGLWERLQRDGAMVWPLLRPAWRMLRSFPGALVLHRLRVTGRIGLPDPARTGQIQGAVIALRELLPDRVEIDVESDFVEQGARGEGSVCFHLYPGKLLYYILRFVVTAGVLWVSARVSLWRTNRAQTAAGSSAA